MRPCQPERLPPPQLPTRRHHRRRIQPSPRARQRFRLPQRRHHRHRPRLSWRSIRHVGGRQTRLEQPPRATPSPFITASFDVKFHRPTPLGPTVRLTASAERVDPSRIIVRSEIAVDHKVTATMTATWAPLALGEPTRSHSVPWAEQRPNRQGESFGMPVRRFVGSAVCRTRSSVPGVVRSTPAASERRGWTVDSAGRVIYRARPLRDGPPGLA